ncbi:HEAT repeat domain-containing protein [Bythopirellula polymerisocia]|uniref:HEAT repeat protein n=1 Tax=Bythopirellula polymerisocia TaxID=2528003 RepID=A0A5C6D293_9BACT|nr:hypothetical protein [Bythopirellula polymerisocia]TWU29901.1 hypothetical protein Pla144_06810 [Bythopirellula polymerisocia]
MNPYCIIRDLLPNPRLRAASLLLCALMSLPASGQEQSAILTEAASRSPAVAAILDIPREKPADAMSVVLTLIDLGESSAAAEVFKPLAAEKLTPEEMAEIANQLGTARLLSLATKAEDKQIPGARVFAQKCMDAAAKEARKPENLDRLIGDLGSDSAETRQAARHDLAVIGFPAAEASMHALATSTDKETRTQLLLALAEMRPLVNPLIVAALAEGEGQFRRDVAELAGHLQLLEAIPWLATLAAGGDQNSEVVATAQAALVKMGLSLPDQNDAVAVVRRGVERLEAGIPADEISVDSDLWWSYDPEKQRISSRQLSPALLRSLALVRISQNFLALATASVEDRQLAIVSAIEASGLLGEAPPEEVMELVKGLTTEELNSILALALKSDRGAAAITICSQLGDRGDLAALTSFDGLPTPLARAVNDPNLEVQFAALAAIMKINPRQSFAGASAVPAALWRFVSSSGTPQAVVGAPTAAHADDWAGALRGMGYDATPVFTGIEVVKQALASPRLELLLVDSDIGKPLLREVLYQIRTHSRLAHVPVAVLAGNEDLALAAEIAEKDKYLLAVSRPHGADAMKSLVNRLTVLGDHQFTAEARTQQSTQALEWLAMLMKDNAPYDELLRYADSLENSVYRAELAAPSLEALAVAGTAGSQQTLAAFASQPTQPIELRRQAAKAFSESFERFGCLLTAEQIAAQYDRYNASETADPDTQQVLGEILDTIEKKKRGE